MAASDDQQYPDRDFVEYVLKAIVLRPDDVTVSRTVDELGVLVTIGVHPEDMGTVIGKNGQTAKSVRTLLRVIGAKSNLRVNMKILEPEGGRHAERASATADAALPSLEGTEL